MPIGPSVDIGHVLDTGQWGGYQRRLVLFTALAIIFDGIDNQLMGITVPTLMREWSLPRSAFAPVLSLGYFGMMIGGAVAGLAGDRLGRRVALLGSMFVFGAMTLAVTFVNGVTALAALRLLTGIGLGGAIPNGAALAAEYVPKRQRPLAVTVTIVCVPLGATIAGLVAIRALPAYGWRTLFAVGGVLPILAALALAKLLPESPRYLARHPSRWPELVRSLARMGHLVPPETTFSDRTEGAGRASIRALFVPGFRADTFAVWVAFLSCMLAVYLGFGWVPSMLAGAGFSSSVASGGITAFNLGGVVGALAGGAAIARIGSRASMLAMAVLAVASASVMSAMSLAAGASLLPIIVMLTITGAAINGVQTTLYALAAHVYPAPMRATGVGTAASVGRTGAVLSGYVGAWALEYRGSASFFWVVGASMAICAIALAMVKRHVART
jgi:AAHS family 4-hydroxybenzoate transporter-like MFS transporter